MDCQNCENMGCDVCIPKAMVKLEYIADGFEDLSVGWQGIFTEFSITIPKKQWDLLTKEGQEDFNSVVLNELCAILGGGEGRGWTRQEYEDYIERENYDRQNAELP